MEAFSEAQLVRYLEGACTEDEEREIEAWLRADPERQRSMQELTRIWEAAERPMRARDVDQMWAELSEEMDASETFDAQGASAHD